MLKLGRLPRAFNPAIPSLSPLLSTRALAPIPAKHSWLTGLPADLGMMANDQLGDCTCAAYYHAKQVWTQDAQGAVVTEPDADVIALYEDACGYVAGDPSTDRGGNEQAVLTYLAQTGAPSGPAGASRDKLAAFFEIDVRNLGDVQRAIYESGVAYIGLDVPAYLMAQAPPAVWDVSPSGDQSIVGGHAVVLAGYDATAATFDLISWGQRFTMTAAFWRKFVDEAYALISPDWIEKTGSTPLGLTEAELAQQMSALVFD